MEEMLILGFGVDTNDNWPILLLEAKSEETLLALKMSPVEGLTVTLALKERSPLECISQELLCRIIGKLKGEIHAMEVVVLDDEVFRAKLRVKQHEEEFIFDCRLGDGLALAVRFGVAIYVPRSLLEEKGQQSEALKKTILDLEVFLAAQSEAPLLANWEPESPYKM